MTTLISVTLALAYPRDSAREPRLPQRVGYGLAMRVLYGRYYAARDAAVAAHIPDGASVLELCCGPARLYLRELRGRIGSYVAIDASPRFVDRLRRRGVDARQADVATAPSCRSPTSWSCRPGCTSSCPTRRRMLQRMRAAAEAPSSSQSPCATSPPAGSGVVARLGASGAATAQGAQPQRFDAASLRELMLRFGDAVQSCAPAPGGREHVYVLSGTAGARPAA